MNRCCNIYTSINRIQRVKQTCTYIMSSKKCPSVWNTCTVRNSPLRDYVLLVSKILLYPNLCHLSNLKQSIKYLMQNDFLITTFHQIFQNGMRFLKSIIKWWINHFWSDAWKNARNGKGHEAKQFVAIAAMKLPI